MLSDVLHTALEGITHYQGSQPRIYDSHKHHIEHVKREMFRLLMFFDASHGLDYIFARAVDDTEPTTEKKALDMAERYAAIRDTWEKIVREAKAKIGLTTEDFTTNSSPEIVKKIKIFDRYVSEKFEAWVRETEQAPMVKS